VPPERLQYAVSRAIWACNAVTWQGLAGPIEIDSVKEHIEELLAQSLLHLQREGVLPVESEPAIQLERTRSPEHGEFATNLAMSLSKAAGMPPRELAQAIIDHMPRSRQVERLEIAGPGFVNFFLNRRALTGVIRDVLRQGKRYGKLIPAREEHITIEFVSANPTGPLHVGHGRGAAYGDSLANILEYAGHRVQREYYVNRAQNFRKMDTAENTSTTSPASCVRRTVINGASPGWRLRMDCRLLCRRVVTGRFISMR
jgi:hypothetical protein